MSEDIKPGDQVRVKAQYTHGGIMGIWIAEKKLTKNWELKRPDSYKGMNAHKKLRAKPEQLEKVTAENVAVSPNALPPLPQIPHINTFTPIGEGTVVLVNDPSGKIKPGVYVVTKGNISNPERLNIAEFGGGKLWRVPVSFVKVIPKDQLKLKY